MVMVFRLFIKCSGPGAQQLSGRKRPHSSSVGRKLGGNESGRSLSVLPAAAQAPVCRPWDRGDLVRRLSTFKSMTWFAKPQVCHVFTISKFIAAAKLWMLVCDIMINVTLIVNGLLCQCLGSY